MSDSLSAALCRAQARIAGVEKSSKNDYHKYKYTSAETMIDHCRLALASEGLALLPMSQVIDVRPITYQEKSGEKSVPAVLVCHYLLLGHGESFALSTEVPIVPEAGRPLDKARFAAATEALGYLLRDLLLVPRGEGISEREDPDETTKTSGGRQEKPEEPNAASCRKALLDACAEVGVPEPALEAFLLDKMGKTLDQLTAQQAVAVAGRVKNPEVQKQIWAVYAGPGGEG